VIFLILSVPISPVKSCVYWPNTLGAEGKVFPNETDAQDAAVSVIAPATQQVFVPIVR
jgi:hypothetical protein